MPDSRPIGIFDSGIGGLTIARAIHELLPDEKIIFFGDTAHLPYGDKSSAAIRGYVSAITDWLLEKDCKMVVIACNSASAAGYPALKKKYGESQHILNVVDPIVAHVASHSEYKKVGVIGTKATISSRIFPKKFHIQNPDLDVRAVATPLLAPMIEEGFFNNKISQTIINAYLDKSKLQGIDALVLACTHYPLIRKQIEKYYKAKGEKVQIIDAMEVMARHTRNLLQEHDLLAPENSNPIHHFHVSDFTNSFQKTTEFFFGHTVRLEHTPIWKQERC